MLSFWYLILIQAGQQHMFEHTAHRRGSYPPPPSPPPPIHYERSMIIIVKQRLGTKSYNYYVFYILINMPNDNIIILYPQRWPTYYETVNECWLEVGPPSTMLAHRQASIGSISRVC